MLTKVKELVNQEAKILATQLKQVLETIDQIIKHREYNEQAVGLEHTELDQLTNLCESYLDDIAILYKGINYLTLERSEGKLYQDNKGCFKIEGIDIALNKGNPIEVMIEINGQTAWQIGRIIRDHTSDSYYFLGQDNKRYQLEPGMPAAIRLESLTKNSCQGHHA